MCLPKGQEAELAGFFVYCTQILGWLPPLLFSILNEQGVPQKYGVLIACFGFAVSILLLSCTASWPEIVAEAECNAHINKDFFVPADTAADAAASGIDATKELVVGDHGCESVIASGDIADARTMKDADLETAKPQEKEGGNTSTAMS